MQGETAALSGVGNRKEQGLILPVWPVEEAKLKQPAEENIARMFQPQQSPSRKKRSGFALTWQLVTCSHQTPLPTRTLLSISASCDDNNLHLLLIKDAFPFLKIKI